MLKPGERLLDIGCGWGALALRAAQKYGAQVVGVTLSKNQYALACERVAQAGLADQVEIRLQDYRDIDERDGQFDKITSIGMFEHVGLNHLEAYFAQDQRPAQGRWPGAEPRHHLHRPGQRCHAAGGGQLHRKIRVSRMANCRISAWRSRTCRAPGWKRSMWNACAATTRARWPAGRTTMSANRTPFARW